MSRLDQHVAAVQNRLALERFVRALAWTCMACASVALLFVLVDRFLQLRPSWPMVWLESGVGLAIVVALVHAIRRRPSKERAAAAIDAKLGLSEKISTAIFLRPSSDPFAMAAVRDAEATAENVVLHVGRHFPLRFPKAGIFTMLIAMAAGLSMLLPSFDMLGRTEKLKQIQAQQSKVESGKRQLQDALAVVNAVPQSLAGDDVIRLAKQDLTAQLKAGAGDPAKASRTALKALQDVDAAVKQQIKTNAQFAQAKADEKMWKQIGDQPITDAGPINEARKELADGKFTDAINDLSNVVNNFDKMDKKEQEKAAEQMKQMAQQLAQQANPPPQQQQQQQQQQMQQMGMNQQQAQQAQQLMQQAANGNKQAQQQLAQMAQQAMQQMNNGQGPNAQQKQQLQQMMQQAQATANNQAQAQQLAQAAQQMAQAMQQQAQQQQGQQGGQQAQKGQQGAQQGNKGQQGQQQANGQGAQQKQGGQQAQGQQAGAQQAQAQQMGQGMQQMQAQLQQMQAVAADAQQMAAAQQAAQQGAQQAMNGANGAQAPNGAQPGGNGQWPGNGGGQQGGPPPNAQWNGQGNNGLQPNNGGFGAGDRSGKAYAPYTVKEEISKSQDNEKGRLLASTYVKAGTVKGESKEQLKEVAASAQKEMTDEIDQDRVSRQAQKVVREYFSSMQNDAEATPAPAPAPDASHK